MNYSGSALRAMRAGRLTFSQGRHVLEITAPRDANGGALCYLRELYQELGGRIMFAPERLELTEADGPAFSLACHMKS